MLPAPGAELKFIPDGLGAALFPKMRQDSPKIAPAAPQDRPRPPRDHPKSGEDRPRTPQDPPRPPQDPPRLAQDIPRTPRTTQYRPKYRPKTAQDPPQDRLKSARRRPKDRRKSAHIAVRPLSRKQIQTYAPPAMLPTTKVCGGTRAASYNYLRKPIRTPNSASTIWGINMRFNSRGGTIITWIWWTGAPGPSIPPHTRARRRKEDPTTGVLGKAL